MRIDRDEAAVVVRIFEAYADGQSASAIGRFLNKELVPGRIRSSRGWSTGSVTRILDQQKYIGDWVWNKTGARRDPRTGQRRVFTKDESEWCVGHHESLRIVAPELWDRVRARRTEVRRVWPGAKRRPGFSKTQRGRVDVFPESLLSGAMVCGRCERGIVQVSGRHGGYYGCVAARVGGCENRAQGPSGPCREGHRQRPSGASCRSSGDSLTSSSSSSRRSPGSPRMFPS